MTKTFEIIDVDGRSVDSCEYCGANPLGHARKREWIRQCLPNGLRYKTVAESGTEKTVGMIEYMPAESAWRDDVATKGSATLPNQKPADMTGSFWTTGL